MDIQQIRLKAQNENTTVEILTELAHSKDRLTRQYVASNPNTPVEILQIEILEKLADEFPTEIVANPIFDILIIENANTPISLKLSVERNPNSSKDRMEFLDLPTIDRIINLLYVENYEQIRALKKRAANNPNSSERVLKRLSNDRDREIRIAIAKNPNSSEKILEQLKSDRDIDVRLIVAGNPNTPINTLTELANSIDKNIASKAQYNLKVKTKAIQQAQNENTSSKLLTQLASNKSKIVRQYVASNPNTHIGVLRRLAEEFPEEVIANSIFDLLILEHFAKHPKSVFVHAVMLARGSKTPVETFFSTFGNDSYAWYSDFY